MKKPPVSKTGQRIPDNVEAEIQKQLQMIGKSLVLSKRLRSSPFRGKKMLSNGKSYYVREMGEDQWYIIDSEYSKVVAGPFYTETQAWSEISKLGKALDTDRQATSEMLDKLAVTLPQYCSVCGTKLQVRGDLIGCPKCGYWEENKTKALTKSVPTLEVAEQGGQWYVLYKGKRKAGPFASKEEAKAELDDLRMDVGTGAKSKSLPGYRTKDRGQPCKQGEAAARTGCIPATKPEGKPTQPKTEPQQPEKKKESAEDIGAKNKKWAEENYDKLKDEYLHNPDPSKGGIFDENGELKSIVLNTDDWRELFPGYVGTNSQDVHGGSSFCNKKLFKEALATMKGKGNNTMVVLAGGGGSGKSTAGRYINESEYPIRLDQVSDELDSLVQKMKDAQEAGFMINYMFVNRPPPEAWIGGVVKRAVEARKKGLPARTVPLKIALKANIEARRTAAELIKSRPDIPVAVIDNTDFKNVRLIQDRDEAYNFLSDTNNYDFDKLYQELKTQTEAMDIPDDIKQGLLTEDVAH